MIASRISASESTSTDDGLKAIKAEVNEERTPIGCAAFGKLFKIILNLHLPKSHF